jgi:aryl-alcohol dehydrogenase-like predicted oxidoreductase
VNLPRFSGENLEANQQHLQPFFDMAQRKGCTPAQLALAWVHAQRGDVFPIPGTKTPSRVEENIRSLEVLSTLTAEEVRLLGDTVTSVGDRYTAEGMAATFNSRV